METSADILCNQNKCIYMASSEFKIPAETINEWTDKQKMKVYEKKAKNVIFNLYNIYKVSYPLKEECCS